MGSEVVARRQERKFHGLSFVTGAEVTRVMAPKAPDRAKQRVREITRCAKGVNIAVHGFGTGSGSVGWGGYVGFCEMSGVLIGRTSWSGWDYGRLFGGSVGDRVVLHNWYFGFGRDWPANTAVVGRGP